jgi:hypothetical protein
MADASAFLVAREFDQLNHLMEETFGDCFGVDEITPEMPKEEIEAKLHRFAAFADQAIPKIEWILIHSGDILSAEQRSTLSLYRGQLCEMLAIRMEWT